MNPVPIILALLMISFILRSHIVGLWCIWRAKTPVKKEIHRMLYQLDANRDEEAAGKHLHNAIMMKAEEI